MSAPTMPDLQDVPPLPEAFGDAAGAAVAERALTENELRDDDENHEPSTQSQAPAAAAPTGSEVVPAQSQKSSRSKKSQSPAGSDVAPAPPGETAGAAKPERMTVAKARRLGTKVLADRYVQLHTRAVELEAENVELHRRAAVVQAVGSDVVDDGIRAIAEEVVGLVDNGAQAVAHAMAGPVVADAIALDPEHEKKKLVRLSCPVLKKYLAERAQMSPEIALVMGLLGIGLGKFVAVKLATASVPAVARATASPQEEVGNGEEA